MTIDEIKRKLCCYDPENPFSRYNTKDGQEPPKPRRKGCGCDNCFYGRDQLAVELLNLIQQYTNTTNHNTP
jgi:hypothetical protein